MLGPWNKEIRYGLWHVESPFRLPEATDEVCVESVLQERTSVPNFIQALVGYLDTEKGAYGSLDILWYVNRGRGQPSNALVLYRPMWLLVPSQDTLWPSP